MRVLTWNLFHGRSVPGAGRDLMDDFAAALAGWAWDVALLQEVPPWWPPALGRAAGAHARTALTSRNVCLLVQRPLARRLPDLLKSWGGGANAILVRGAVPHAHRRHTLRRLPERRVAHGVGLAGGAWAVNLHAQAHAEALAHADLAQAARVARAWAGEAPVLLGGDLNLSRDSLRLSAPPDFAVLGGRGVDWVCGRGFTRDGDVETPDRGGLSDHAAVIVPVERSGAP